MRTCLIGVVLLAACSDDAGPVLPDAGTQIDATALPKIGQVVIIEDKETNSTLWAAAFGTDPSVYVVSRDDGPCHVSQTQTSTPFLVSAGTLAISGGSPTTVTLAPDANNRYVMTMSALSYAARDALAVSASGGVVPAFTTTIEFPTSVTPTSPAPASLRKVDLTLTWNATASPVMILVSQYPSGQPGLQIGCVYEGTAGTGTVPGSAFAELVTGVSAAIAITTRTNVMLTSGDYPVEVSATYGARIDDVPVSP